MPDDKTRGHWPDIGPIWDHPGLPFIIELGGVVAFTLWLCGVFQ